MKIAYDPQIFSGRFGRRYCEQCVFHDEDMNVSELARSDEIVFFSGVRRDGYPPGTDG